MNSDLPPVVSANATPTGGPTPLSVDFSSHGSFDPEGQPLTYSWIFGDGATSTPPTHTHLFNRRRVSGSAYGFGRRQFYALPAANYQCRQPTGRDHFTTPSDDGLFRAGDVITFSGSATDLEDGALPASAYTWNIDFLHEGHVHPGTPITGVTSGFHHPDHWARLQRLHPIPHHPDGHRLSGLQSSQSVTVFPDKVTLTFDTAPGGLTFTRRHRPHGAVRLRHAYWLQSHDRSTQSDRRREHIQVRLLVRRRCATAHVGRAEFRLNLTWRCLA